MMWKDLRIYIVNNNPMKERYSYDAEKKEIGHVEYWPLVRPKDARYGDIGVLYYVPQQSFTRLYMCLGKLTEKNRDNIIKKYGLKNIDNIYGGCIFKDIYKFETPIGAVKYAPRNPIFGKLKDKHLVEILQDKHDPGKKEFSLYIRIYRFIKYWLEVTKETNLLQEHMKYHSDIHKEVLQRFSLLNSNSKPEEVIEKILTSPTNSYRTFKKMFGWPRAIPNFISQANDDEKYEMIKILKDMDSSNVWKDEWVDKMFSYLDKYAHTDEVPSRKKRKTMLYTLLAELYGYRHIKSHPIYNSPVRHTLEKLFALKPNELQNNYLEYEEYFYRLRDFYKAIMCYIKQDNYEKICEFVGASDEDELNMEIDCILWYTYSGKETLGEKLKEFIDEQFYLIPNTTENSTVYKEEAITTLLNDKNQIILYGPPGTGKTWIANKYANKYGGNNVEFVTFHPSFSYEDFVEGIRPIPGDNGELRFVVEEGTFKRFSREAYNQLMDYLGKDIEWMEDEDIPATKLEDIEISKEDFEDALKTSPKFYLLIDEINRGDISKIFGELITLLENDKRVFRDNAMISTLPYSKKKFGVPPNLYLIGTMNTADRSIALIDVALRRRFGFLEIMPNLDMIKKELNVNTLPEDTKILAKKAIDALGEINKRISENYDRDHQIGHSYYLQLKNIADKEYFENKLKSIWLYEIIPLLQEYFYGDSKKLSNILFPCNTEEIDVFECYKKLIDEDLEGFLDKIKTPK